MVRNDGKVGMKVVFGKPGETAERSLGEIIKLNPTRAQVKLLEERGRHKTHPVGTVFQVPYSLMEPAPTHGNKSTVTIQPQHQHQHNQITPGITTFRAIYQDCRPLWKVVRKDGHISWICEVVNEKMEIDGKIYDAEYLGVTKLFSTNEILNALHMARAMENIEDEQTRFFASLIPGSIVHYHDGFQQFLRCRVVNKDGINCLQPIAMIGKWGTLDLPKRQNDGSIYYGYHAEQIRKGETFQPNYGFIYEHPSFSPRQIDPTTLTPIDLTLPELTHNETVLAAKWRKIKEIHDACDGNNPDIILANVRRILDTTE